MTRSLIIVLAAGCTRFAPPADEMVGEVETDTGANIEHIVSPDTDDETCGAEVYAEITSDDQIGHAIHEVEAYPVFYLSASSPSGGIGNGDKNIFVVKAEARCGRIVIEELIFDMIGSDNADTDWMAPAEDETFSGVAYAARNESEELEAVFDCYGICEGDDGPSYMTRDGTETLKWEVSLSRPIELEEGETATFALVLAFGEHNGVIPTEDDMLRGGLDVWSGWYGPDNDFQPNAGQRVAVLCASGINGNTLVYDPE